MKKRLAWLAVVIGVVVPVPPTAACPYGSISFQGSAQPIPGATTWADAHGVDFGSAVVTRTTGGFQGLDGLDAVFSDFYFRPLSPSPVNPLWNVSAYEFVLEGVTVVVQNSRFILLRGAGYVIGPGTNGPKPGRWIFTSKSPGSFTSAIVPEPAMLPMVALGLLGAAAVARRRRRCREHRS